MFTAAANRMSARLLLVLLACVACAALGYPRDVSATPPRISIGAQIDIGDYEYLGDYGEWVRVPQFGTVWRPYVVADWSPFFYGHWSWTNFGWTWISYEPFGWLVFHYGFWYFEPYMGWFWIPGRIWSPARVEWYTYGDYCSWAPMPPPHYRWPAPWEYRHHHGFRPWVVVNINHFGDEYIGHHRIDPPDYRPIGQRDVYARRAPEIRQVERVTKREIPMVRITKERSELSRESRAPIKYTRPKESERQRMVLPEREMSRVKEHAPAVEREVLTPKKAAPERREEPQQRERKTTTPERTKVKRR